MMTRLTALACFFLCNPLSAFGQSHSAITAPSSISISGEVTHSLQLNAQHLQQLKRQSITVKDPRNGANLTFEGYALSDVLQLAGVEFGTKLSGKNLSLFLVAEALDGYRVVFSLPEMDLAFSAHPVLLADRKNGRALDASHGPWQIIVPHEKRPTRWVRQVNRLSIQRAQ